MSVNEKMTAIADAIRAKTGGTDPLSLDGMAVAIDGISTGGASFTFTVTVTTGAVVTATKDGKTVSAASVDGVAVLTVTETGEWTLTATLGDIAIGPEIIYVEDAYAVILANPVLNDNTWEVIRSIGAASLGASYWSVGDCKELPLNGTLGKLVLEDFRAFPFIIGFDHNSKREGTGRIHFHLAKNALAGGVDIALCDSDYNKNASSTGGFIMNWNDGSGYSSAWSQSFMRKNICGTSLTSYSATSILAVIPDELRAALVSVKKYTCNQNTAMTSDVVSATTDYFFLLSEYEVFGTITQTNTYEANYQAQYEYYAAGNSPIKYNHSAPETAVHYSLRSIAKSDVANYCVVWSNATHYHISAMRHSGFAPGFCVGGAAA